MASSTNTGYCLDSGTMNRSWVETCPVCGEGKQDGWVTEDPEFDDDIFSAPTIQSVSVQRAP